MWCDLSALEKEDRSDCRTPPGKAEAALSRIFPHLDISAKLRALYFEISGYDPAENVSKASIGSVPYYKSIRVRPFLKSMPDIGS